MLQSPQTILDAIYLFKNQTETQVSRQVYSNLKTALRRYILPNIPNYECSIQDLDKAGFECALNKISIEKFLEINVFDILFTSCQSAINEGRLGKNTERTSYRPAVNKFIKWLQQQQWLNEAARARCGKYTLRKHRGGNIMAANKGNRALHQCTSYRLRDEWLTSRLTKQIDCLQDFCTSEFVPHRRDKKMRQKTFDNHKWRILSFWGWLVKFEDYNLDQLDLNLMLNIDLLNDFIRWGINTRKNSYGWAQGFTETALNIAKCSYAHKSKRPMYRDIDAVEELRVVTNQLAKLYEEQRKNNKRSKRSEKEMTFEQCIEIVDYLRKDCAPRDSYGAKRSDFAIVKSWQRYLLVAILTYCPVRQRELRELEIGRTLVRSSGSYRMVLQPDDNKTGDERDFLLSAILPPEVVADLDEWIDVWRPKIREATLSVDNWLGFVARRRYKNEEQLHIYLNNLNAKYESLVQANNLGQAKDIEKEVRLIEQNLKNREKAQVNFQDKSFFISPGDTSMLGFGKQISASGLFNVVTRAVFSASRELKKSGHPLFRDIDPRKTNPHYFRNIAITHERRHGNPAKRKAFHKVLGNSEQVGDRDYNEMHPSEKTVDAQGWWQSDILQSNTGLVAHIRMLLEKLPEEEKEMVFRRYFI